MNAASLLGLTHNSLFPNSSNLDVTPSDKLLISELYRNLQGIFIIRAPGSSHKPRSKEDNRRVNRQRHVESLVQKVSLPPLRPLRFLGRMRNPRNLIPVQQLLTIRHRRWGHRIFDGNRTSRRSDEPNQRRPTGMGEDVK